MRSALRALLLAALVATAGRSGAFGGDSDPATETTTTDDSRGSGVGQRDRGPK